MTNTPALTPNVRIEDPKARKVIGNTIGWAGVAITAATIVDAALPQIDITAITVPATQIVLGFLALFQTLITSPNVPTYQAPTQAPLGGSSSGL
jgi:hypothetical protein